MRIFQVGLMTGAYVSTQSYAIEIVGKDYKPMVACMICGIPSSIGYIAMAFRNLAFHNVLQIDSDLMALEGISHLDRKLRASI